MIHKTYGELRKKFAMYQLYPRRYICYVMFIVMDIYAVTIVIVVSVYLAEPRFYIINKTYFRDNTLNTFSKFLIRVLF